MSQLSVNKVKEEDEEAAAGAGGGVGERSHQTHGYEFLGRKSGGRAIRMQKKVRCEQRNQARDLTWCSWFERNNPDFNTISRWPKQSLLSSDFVYHTSITLNGDVS